MITEGVEMDFIEIIKYIAVKLRGVVISQLFVLLVGIIIILMNYNNLDLTARTVAMSIGTAFIAGAIVSFLDLVRNTVEFLLNNKVTKVLECGITGVYEHRDIEEYYELIKKSKEIDICGYSIRGFMQSHSNTILELAKNPNFKMRIVLVDPDSEVSINREKLEGEGKDTYKNQCQKIINTFKNCNNIKIYYVDFALSTMIFRIDKVMYVGPHFIKTASKSSFTMKLEGKWGYNDFQSEFEEMCKRGNEQSISLESKMKET